MRFCTAINCMDGRVQLPVIEYLQKRFGAEYVDSITEPGPILILAEESNSNLVESIFNRIRISVDRHNSVGIAVVGHHDCAANPATKDQQVKQIADAIRLIKHRYSDIEIIGLWGGENWEVTEL